MRFANAMRVALICALVALVSSCATEQQRASGAAPWLNASAPQSYVVVTVRNSTAPAVRAGSTARDYDAVSTYGPSPRARADVDAIAARYGLRPVNAWPIDVLRVHCIVYALTSNDSVDAIVKRLRQDKRVESAQPLNSFAALASDAVSPLQAKTYSDPYFKLQTNLQMLEVPRTQQFSRGEGVRVAVVDTGIDAGHPDLVGRVAVQRDFVGAAQVNAASERHGTAVAGVIAALDNNREGIVGVAPGARLLALRACWQAGRDDARALCNTFTIAQALAAAIELRADVVNLSLGGPADPLLDRLVDAGMRRGIVYVGAMAPNVGAADTLFPANIGGVISVNNADEPRNDVHSVRAPGNNILTLVPGGYDFMSGSSLAAASVSGGVALLLSHRRSTRRAALYSALMHSEGVKQSVDFCVAMAEIDKRTTCAR